MSPARIVGVPGMDMRLRHVAAAGPAGPFGGHATLGNNVFAGWRMDEASGTRADILGTYTLTDNNTVGSVAGKNGTAASFVSGNSESLTYSSYPDSNGGNFGWSIWFYPTATGQGLMSSGDYVTAGELEFAIWLQATDTIRIRYDDGGVLSQADRTVDMALNTWHHMIVSRSGSVITPYFDGAALTTISHTAVSATVDNLVFGAVQWGGGPLQFATAYIDETINWSRALTAAEASSLWNSGAGLFY